MNNKFIDFMGKYSNEKLAVAVSGGADSICLLHWLVALGLRPVVLHVNHGLRDVADTETKYVEKTASELELAHKTFYWDGACAASNIESAARDARYKLMIDYCRENNLTVLLTAHHADDQIETFLMNLGRGSGVYGLAAMRSETVRDGVKIVRPLLTVPRNDLEKYCIDHKIKFFNDEMNADEKYTRVRIRKNRHVLSSGLGISDDRILLAIENLGRTRDALEEHISLKIKSEIRNHKSAIFHESFLFDEPMEIGLKLLGCLVQKIGGGDYGPRLNSLNLALTKLGGNCKITLGGCVLRRLNDKILIVKNGESTSFKEQNEKSKSKKEIF